MKRYTSIAILLLLIIYCSSPASASDLGSFFSFTTVNRFSNSPNEFGEVDDVRKFTSEALFSESESRLNRPLTEEEINALVRTKKQWETFNILQLSVSRKTSLDFSYKYRELKDAQITNFYTPDEFNDVDVQEWGIALRTTITKPSHEIFFRGAFKPIRRKGIVEFLPEAEEDVYQYEFNSIFSYHFEKNTLSLYPTLVYMDINPDIDNPPDRDRFIGALSLTYGNLLSKEWEKRAAIPISSMERLLARQFDRRGLKFFGGILFDQEAYDETNVTKMDYYLGTTIDFENDFSFAIQPGIFTYTVDDDSSQDNSQYRTTLLLYFPPIKVIQITLPFRHDIAIDGPDYYENWKAGLELSSYFFFSGGRFMFAGALRYDYQDYYQTDEALNIFSLNLSLEF